ncbi:glycosyltransferase [Erythrobacter sp. HA6-11]
MARILLDMTRAAARRWNGANPTGIDRVCDAYAAYFSQRAIAVIQIRGRAVILNRAASDELMMSLDLPVWRFRRALASFMARSAAAPVQLSELKNAFYINVGHSDFDLAAHWRWVGRHAVKPVYLLHDLIPITNPSVTTAHKTARHRGRVESALQQASGIVANSQTTADALANFAEAHQLAMPPLLVSHIAGGALPSVRPPLTPNDAPFVAVGTVERRKNCGLLLRVWEQLVARLGESCPPLVFAGGLGKGSEEVLFALENKPELSRSVRIESDLDDRSMAKLITGARAVLLPSFAEGYGIPLVEALERGVPVIGSNLASFKELGQGIPTLLDPNDDQAWIDSVLDFCMQGEEYKRQRIALSGFNPPRWSRHFAMLDSWLNQLESRQETVAVQQGRLAALA